MNEKRLEELLRERARRLEAAVLGVERDALVRGLIADEAEREADEAERDMRSGRRTGGPGWRYYRAAAALLLVAGLVGLGVWQGRPSEPLLMQVATLETAATMADYRALYGLDAERLPDLDRGVRERPQPAGEIVAYAAEAERRSIVDALAARATTDKANWYKIVFETASECSAVVIHIDPDGSTRRDFPDERAGHVAGQRFGPGQLHILPRPSVSLTRTPQGDFYDYDPGFVRPRSVEQRIVLLALRGEPFDLEELDGFLAEGWPGDPGDSGDSLQAAQSVRIRTWLEDRGGSVSERLVRRP